MEERQLLIVDAQVHIWESGTPVSIHRQVPRYTQDELLRDMDEAGVARVLLHPPSWDARANEVALEAARQHPDRLAIVGFFDVSKPEHRSLVETWKQQPGMLGLRFAFLKPGEENWLVDGTTDWLWPAAERAGVPVGLLVPNRCKVVAGIAAKHPGLRLFIDHMARPRHSQDDAGFATGSAGRFPQNRRAWINAPAVPRSYLVPGYSIPAPLNPGRRLAQPCSACLGLPRWRARRIYFSVAFFTRYPCSAAVFRQFAQAAQHPGCQYTLPPCQCR